MAGLAEAVLTALDGAVPDGFTRVGDRRWVGELRGQIRTIVEFQALKGAQYSGRWGFGVDLVPLLRGSRLAWKKTVRTAAFDLTIDPIDDLGAVPHWCAIPVHMDAGSAQAVAQRVWHAAAQDFAAVTTIVDLLGLFHRRSSMTFRRFGLQHYAQTDLAWGLLRIATGELAEGDRQLGRFCARHDVRPDDPVLRKAVTEAQALARSSQDVADTKTADRS